jgi:DNA-3-methyladenine glycosylase
VSPHGSAVEPRQRADREGEKLNPESNRALRTAKASHQRKGETQDQKTKSEPGVVAASARPGFKKRVSGSLQVAIRQLQRNELPQHTVALARFLIGKIVVHDLPQGRISGRIVEAEAYPPGDPAGHHFRGPTPRIRSMYLAPGHAYVFFNYGNHFMLNVSSEPEGRAGGILIRALEPLEGLTLMEKHRGTWRLLDLTRGPGRLAAALQITREHDGIDLTASQTLWLGELGSCTGEKGKARCDARIGRTLRIGITRAADRLLRFYEQGNPFVSGPKRLLVQGRGSLEKRTSARNGIDRIGRK